MHERSWHSQQLIQVEWINIPYEEPSAAWTKLEKMTKMKIDRPRELVLALMENETV